MTDAVLISKATTLYSESGRKLAPLPGGRMDTKPGMRKFDAWIRDEALAEVAGDDYRETLVRGMDPKGLSPCDLSLLNTILFGSEVGATAKHTVVPHV